MATKIVTGKVRFSYANVWEPRAIDNSEGARKKYSVSILIPKSDKKTLAAVKAAIDEALELGASKFGGKVPKPGTFKYPLRDGDAEREDNPEYAGMMFINANSDNAPGIVDRDKNEILDKSEFYSGCYGRASVNFYAFNTNGNKGIACGLNNLQKLADGPRLSGGATAEEDFKDDFEDDDMM